MKRRIVHFINDGLFTCCLILHIFYVFVPLPAVFNMDNMRASEKIFDAVFRLQLLYSLCAAERLQLITFLQPFRKKRLQCVFSNFLYIFDVVLYFSGGS